MNTPRTHPEYASFIVRLWCKDSPNTRETTADLHSEVEHIQTGQRWSFATLDETLSFLRQQANALDELALPVSEQIVR